MTREQAIEGIETGIRLVKEKIDEGFNVFLVGEMGISNTTASALNDGQVCRTHCRGSHRARH